jgi:hypothetical protein
MLRLVAPTVALHAAWLASHREWGPGLHEDGYGIAADDEVETANGFARFVQRVSAPPTARLWWILDDDAVVGGIALRFDNAPKVLQQGRLWRAPIAPRSGGGDMGAWRGATART